MTSSSLLTVISLSPDYYYITVTSPLLLSLSSHYCSNVHLVNQAPHWVDGYHDIIFDAMAKMEGAELMPTAEVLSSTRSYRPIKSHTNTPLFYHAPYHIALSNLTPTCSFSHTTMPLIISSLVILTRPSLITTSQPLNTLYK